jgi:hypothetical protein
VANILSLILEREESEIIASVLQLGLIAARMVPDLNPERAQYTEDVVNGFITQMQEDEGSEDPDWWGPDDGDEPDLDDSTPPDYGPPGSGAIITEYNGFEPGLEDPPW